LTLRVLGWIASEQGTSVPAQIEPIIVVLLFGVGTDYALFLLSRTRQALEEGAWRVEAARVGVEKVGGILLSSAAVLIAAFALLVLAELGIYRVLGPGLALALCIVFVVTLTLVPALLAILGPAAFGRRSPARRPDPSWPALQRRSGLIVGVIVAGLILASAGNLGLRVGFDQLANLPDSAASVRGYEELSGEFPGGVLAPVNVLVRGENLDEKNEELLRLQGGLQAELLDAGGSALTFGPQYAGRVPEIDFVTPDGSAARVLLVFNGPPFSPEALDQARRLQDRLPALLEQAGLEDATGVVGGQTALSAAARDTSAADLETVAPLLFAVSFVVLALLLRTPVAPLYLLGSTALSFAATLGVCTVLFQGVLGQDGVVYYVPFVLFLLLVALGSDYNIFIMAAVREETEGRTLGEAVPAALERTGPTINAAGLALAASFLALTLIPLQDFFQVGMAVALGVLLDAFVIRTLLVPALVLLVGPVGFWPAKVRR
jgi:RND superfamily putative drug exporter